jgi:glycosyltransferase involved in cell wall biosynthesis
MLWLAESIWPLVRQARPSARLFIVGQKPPPAVTALDGHAGLTVTGEVPDTRPYIAHAQVYVAPLRMGGGTRLKLLEALALGRPVVSTPLGAEGFQLTSGENVQLAGSVVEFARAVAALLADPPAAARLGQAGQAFVRARYDWSNIVPVMENVCQALARQPA